MQKKIFDKAMAEANERIKTLEGKVAEKDKEIKIQALKIRELISLDKKQLKATIK